MRCRRHNRKIAIQSPTRANNSYGEPIETWAAYATEWAEIKAVKGAETYNGYQEQNTYPVKFTVRYNNATKAINETMRILYDSNYYDIEAVVNYNEMNKEIQIYGKRRGS